LHSLSQAFEVKSIS